MENKPPVDPSSDKEKKSVWPNNFLLTLIVFVVVIVLIMVFLSGGKSAKLDYADLRDLIKQSDPSTKHELAYRDFEQLLPHLSDDPQEAQFNIRGPISVQENIGTNDELITVRYSKVENVRIGKDHLTVKITRQELRPNKGSEDDNGSPSVHRQPASVQWVKVKDFNSGLSANLKSRLNLSSVPYLDTPGFITVTDKNDKDKQYRYEQLHEVMINPFEVTGKVKRTLVGAAATEKEKEKEKPDDNIVEFSTAKRFNRRCR